MNALIPNGANTRLVTNLETKTIVVNFAHMPYCMPPLTSFNTDNIAYLKDTINAISNQIESNLARIAAVVNHVDTAVEYPSCKYSFSDSDHAVEELETDCGVERVSCVLAEIMRSKYGIELDELNNQDRCISRLEQIQAKMKANNAQLYALIKEYEQGVFKTVLPLVRGVQLELHLELSREFIDDRYRALGNIFAQYQEYVNYIDKISNAIGFASKSINKLDMELIPVYKIHVARQEIEHEARKDEKHNDSFM